MLTKILNVLLFNTQEIQGHYGVTVLSVGEIQSSGDSRSPPRKYKSVLSPVTRLKIPRSEAQRQHFYVYTQFRIGKYMVDYLYYGI